MASMIRRPLGLTRWIGPPISVLLNRCWDELIVLAPGVVRPSSRSSYAGRARRPPGETPFRRRNIWFISVVAPHNFKELGVGLRRICRSAVRGIDRISPTWTISRIR